jgi:predicted permease
LYDGERPPVAKIEEAAMLADLVESARRLRARPGFATLATLTLAIGIGAGTAVWSVAAGVLLRPPPYRDPEQLVRVYTLESFGEISFPAPLPAPVMQAWQSLHEVDGVAGYGHTRGVLFLDDRPLRIEGGHATADLFPLLGVELLAGRNFSDGDDSAAVVILDEDLFSRLLGADPARLGERIRFDDGSRTVIGVVPRGLELEHRSPQYWLPARVGDPRSQLSDIARLAPDVTARRARELLLAVWEDLETTAPESAPPDASGPTLRVESLAERLTATARSQLRVLAITAVLVLAIGCANVGGLLLGHLEGRSRELAVRRALGASRLRLVRLLLAEGAWLAGAGGLFGGLLAVALHGFLAARVVTNVPGREGIPLDWRAFPAVLVLSAAAALVVSLVPALGALRRDPVQWLRETSAGAARRAARLRRLSVVAQLAVAVMLLLNAALVLATLLQQLDLAAPIRANRVAVLRLLVPAADPVELAYGDRTSVSVWPLVERLQAMPGVEAAAIGSYVPYVSEGWAAIQIAPTPLGAAAPGPPSASDADTTFAVYATFAGPLLRVLGIPLRAGEIVTAGGDELAGASVVVNARLARDYWPGEDPVGKLLYLPGGQTLTVSGVVDLEVSRLQRLVLRPRSEAAWTPTRTQSFGIVLRTAGDVERLVDQAKTVVAEVAPQAAVETAEPLERAIAAQNAPYRVRGLVYGSIALLALLLALLGVYGVMAQAVSSRVREIGIRLALGARPGQVSAWVLGSGARLVAVGLACGLAGAWAAARVLRSAIPDLVAVSAGTGFLSFELLAGAPAAAWLAIAAAPAVLAGTALLACLFPAARAGRSDPVEALRRGW